MPRRSASRGGQFVATSIIKSEDRERGTVNLSTFAQYFRISGGFCLLGVLVVVILVFTFTDVFSGLFLTWWTANEFNKTNKFYFTGYTGINGVGMVSLREYSSFSSLLSLGKNNNNWITNRMNQVFLIAIAYIQGMAGSKAYHKRAIAGLFRAPMSFFDSQVHYNFILFWNVIIF